MPSDQDDPSIDRRELILAVLGAGAAYLGLPKGRTDGTVGRDPVGSVTRAPHADGLEEQVVENVTETGEENPERENEEETSLARALENRTSGGATRRHQSEVFGHAFHVEGRSEGAVAFVTDDGETVRVVRESDNETKDAHTDGGGESEVRTMVALAPDEEQARAAKNSVLVAPDEHGTPDVVRVYHPETEANRVPPTGKYPPPVDDPVVPKHWAGRGGDTSLPEVSVVELGEGEAATVTVDGEQALTSRAEIRFDGFGTGTEGEANGVSR